MRKIVLFSTFAALILWYSGLFQQHSYEGKISNHFDGRIFHNLQPSSKSLIDFIKWQFNKIDPDWPKWVDSKIGDKPLEKVEGDSIRITLVNHATFLIQTQSMNILTDPIWSENAGPWILGPKRVVAPGIKFEDLPKIDIILISHNHYDHLDLKTLKKLNDIYKPNILAPLGVVKNTIEKSLGKCNCQEMDWWEKVIFNNNLSVSFTGANHWSKRHIIGENSTLWGGFMIDSNGKNIYFAGDTSFLDGQIFRTIKEKYKKFEIALLPIGAYLPRWFMKDSHISPKEAVEIYKILDAKYAVGMHYGTFPLADDKYEQPIQDLQKALEEDDISKENFKILNFGTAWDVK